MKSYLFENMEWHDGVINQISIMSENNDLFGTITISAQIYKNPVISKDRDKYEICFDNSIIFNGNIDLIELKDNIFEGNINNAYIKKDKKNKKYSKYIFDLIEGTIEITSETVSIKKIKELAEGNNGTQ